MSDLTNDEIIRFAHLKRKAENSTEEKLSPADLEEYENGLSQLDGAGYVMLKLADNSLGGKPFVITSDNPKTVERCTSLADYLGVSINVTALAAGLVRIVVGASPSPKPDSMRFFVNENGNIIDGLNRIPAVAVCNCAECQQRQLDDIGEQIYLRYGVLRAQLSDLTMKVDFLCEPEAHALAQVVYWTVYVSRLDRSIGQCESRSQIDDVQSAHTERQPMSLSPFIESVQLLVRDLYSDCEQNLLDHLFKAIDAIVCEWERARTASSRNFIERVSRRMNVSLRSGCDAPKKPTDESEESKDVA